MLRGEWSEPDPAFIGKIVVDDEDNFYGVCEELYDGPVTVNYKERYLAGSFAPNGRNQRRGIAFYKMSNDPVISPLMYVVPDLSDVECGTWAGLTLFGVFKKQGKARVELEEVAFSEEEADEIKAQYKTLNKELNGNGQLIAQLDCCKQILIHAV